MTPEVRRKLGAKRADVRHLITYELRARGYTGASLARFLGCSTANVSKVISGNSHSILVLDALRELGVPEKYLFDPRNTMIAKDLDPDKCKRKRATKE